MAERNLQHISAGYPILSCHELLEYRKNLDQTLPKTGMGKGYLPEESSLQEEFLPSMIEDRLDSLKEHRASRNHDLVQAEWNPMKKRAYVTKWKGKAMQNVGQIINGKTILYPEEVLFLMEMSLLELHSDGSIQSIQEAYRLLLGEQMALEKFQVYSHLRRIGYIVVRHKKRWNDSSQAEPQRQEQDLVDKCSGNNEHSEQHLAETLKHMSKKAYYDYISKKDIDLRKKDSFQIEPKSKDVSYLWEGIDIPNIAGKKFIELKVPPSYLLPKHVCPQKQHYVIDVDGSKNEVEDYYNYNKCYENNVEDHQHFERTSVESNHCSLPSTSHENTMSHSFTETQEQSYHVNPCHMQQYVHNVQSNFNMLQSRSYFTPDHNKGKSGDLKHFHASGQTKVFPSGSETAFCSHRQNEERKYQENSNLCHQWGKCHEENRNYMNCHCTIGSSSDNCQHLLHKNSSKDEPDQFQNANQGYCYSARSEHCPGKSAHNDENLSNVHPSAAISSVSLNNDDLYYCENSYEANRSYRQGPKDSPNLKGKSYKNESHKEPVHEEEISKRHTYKKKYVDKRKCFDRKYKNKRKRQRNSSPENLSLFPRVSKLARCWKEFKHEAELQSTAEYLMNGPAKILWNNTIIPLLAPSNHLTKENVFGALSIIKNMDESESQVPQPLYGKLDFDVYLPSTNYSHYDPGPPDHSIKVVRLKDPTPGLEYRGKVPVHYAVVDNGSVTFFSFSNVKLPSYV